MFLLGSVSIFPHTQGVFRERFVMGEAQLTCITEPQISLGEVACAEPLSIGLHALHRAGPVLDEKVLITGAGTIGAMGVMAAWLAESADVNIEAAGSPAALQTCQAAARRGGRVIQVGTLPAELPFPFPANSVMRRKLDYRGVFRAHLAFDSAVQAIRTRRVDVRPLITAPLPLSRSRSRKAVELALDKTPSTKVQVVAA